MPIPTPVRTMPSTASVLLLEPSAALREVLSDNLTADRFTVMSTSEPRDVIAALSTQNPDAVVISLDLPDAAGLELVTRIRNPGRDTPWDPTVPIVGMSRDVDPHYVVRALERGADEHVARPVHPAELSARLSAIIRRVRGYSACHQVRVGALTVDRRSRRVSVDGTQVCLSAKEYALLEALCRDPQRVLTKDELLRDVWGYMSAGRTRTVDSHASRLRRKLAAAGADQFVANVWGVGYRLLGEAA